MRIAGGGGVVNSEQIVMTVLVVTRRQELCEIGRHHKRPAAVVIAAGWVIAGPGHCQHTVILYNQSQLDTLSRQPGLGPSVMSLCNVFLFNVENDHNSKFEFQILCTVQWLR